MAGRPIDRAYRIKLEAAGGPKMVLDQMAAGVAMSIVARSIGVSRAFLSFHMFRHLAGGRAAVWLARCKAAESAARVSFEEASRAAHPTPALEWISENGGFPWAHDMRPRTVGTGMDAAAPSVAPLPPRAPGPYVPAQLLTLAALQKKR